MANPKLSDEKRQAVLQALDDAGGRTRPAWKLLKERGVKVALGTVSQVKNGLDRGKGHMNPRDPLTRSDLIKRLRKGWVSPQKLADAYGCPVPDVREALDHLEQAGYNLLWDGPRARIMRELRAGGKAFKDHSPIVGNARTFGVIGDTHLCSHYQRLDVLEAAYDAFARAKVRAVYHAGNIVDGHTHYNRFELYKHGITDQAHYCLDHYPQRAGIATYFVTGQCHEGWWFKKEGMDFGRYLMFEAQNRGRQDLVYLGFQEIDIELATRHGSSMMRIFHPGKGSAYAISYKPQKIVESLQGGEKPAMLLVGHFHKAEYVMVRNVHVIQTACTQDQTRFMRSIPTEAHVGFWIVTVYQDKQGAVRRVVPVFENYYDRKYHAALVATA